ncbi:MAG: hypothetical protein FWD42_09590 [Solirubrobacterales bacterium]|nr:hypothetical protein [Solirubrobacterales bacterium]
MRLHVERRTLRLARAMESAYGSVRERELFLVTLRDHDGATGHGEGAPLHSYDGVSAARVEAAFERYREPLGGDPPPGADPQRHNELLLEACGRADPLPQALAAIDLALWDLAGKRVGRPVAELLGDRPRARVTVNATILALDRAGAAEEAARAASDGYRCVKLKVGVGDDAGRVAAVRAAVGPGVALRVDANGAWSVEEAVRAIEALEGAGLELVEEPVHGVEAVRRVRERVSARVAIDETAAQDGALAGGVADAVCLKLSRCGGISGLLDAAARARAGGAEVYVASTLDGPLGVAGAVHAAAALGGTGALAPCGLATLGLLEGVGDPLPVMGGEIAVPRAPGLGVDPP